MSTLRVNNLESLTSGTIASVEEVVEPRAIRVTSISDMEAYSAPVGYVFSLNSGGRSGTFDVIAGDFSTELASDTENGIYIGLADDTTALVKVAKRRYGSFVNAQWFGALGDDDQSTFSIPSYVADSITIDTQTKDAIAINAAIEYIHSIGGGHLHFPKGIYRVYAYLKPVVSNFTITGDGRSISIVKNCSSSITATDGYGVFELNPPENGGICAISLSDITIDGDAQNRVKPTGEYRSYPITVKGYIFLTMINVDLLNSPIDCLRTSYSNVLPDSGLVAINCRLKNAFRNTLSCVSGFNQHWSNCEISGGGQIYGGTNPRFCLDIEPGNADLSRTITNVNFTDCYFHDAVNVIVGGIWCQAKFNNCKMLATGQPLKAGYPWLINFKACQVDFNNCNMEYPADAGDFTGLLRDEFYDSGKYKDSHHIRLSGCEVSGAGVQMGAKRWIIEDTIFKNSARPLTARPSSSYPENTVSEVTINNVTLENVFDNANAGGGTYSSFQTTSAFNGPLYINGLTIRVVPETIDPGLVDVLTTQNKFGFYKRGVAYVNDDSELIVKNVHVKGYYQKLPAILGVSADPNLYRDWNDPGVAPADSTNTIVAPKTTYYKSCTMYGNNA